MRFHLDISEVQLSDPSLFSTFPLSIIATPGRFLHLMVEMELRLSSIQYVVFDEADRLFEMGFSEQLHEILHRLPEARYGAVACLGALSSESELSICLSQADPPVLSDSAQTPSAVC